MKKSIIGFLVIIFSMPAVVYCENNSLLNEQGITILDETMNGVDTKGGGVLEQNNYQDQILSNPETNAAARIGIKQGGDNNMSVQRQSVYDNDLYLKQKKSNGNHNESQTVSHNRKVIIQNESEAIIEQVTP
ncbi:hypothetical protein BIU88_01740 [Chlorobaculum limnaeum]|uniref:Uncharacterized protein n=1 Tax=Chlorobaculum limnaeum TaxID=274537 RepID=A0A1D8D2D7_CHLLM|nr:hypothetical protein [Chlorobaculum limnaeum]AOS82977.1 hypothetical protein BIU88_01740 [Chlorobaculum limnaeum]